MTFSAAVFDNITPSPNDRIVLGICDANRKLFNDESLTRLATQVREKGWKRIDIIPTGSLQRYNKELTQLLTKPMVNSKKAMKDALSDELQTTNKCLSAFIFSDIVGIAYWKPKSETRNTPIRDLKELIQKTVEQLKKICKEEGVTVSITFINGFYHVDTRGNKTMPQTVDKVIVQLNEYTRNAMRLASKKITWKQSHKKEGEDNTFYFDRYFDRLANKNESKSESITAEITPWSAVVLNPHPAYEEAKKSPKILNCQLEGTDEYCKLEALVSKVSKKRLDEILEKQEQYQPQCLSRYIEHHVKYVRKYLLEEIIHYQMLIDNAVKQYESSTDTIKPCVYVAYPMNNPMDLSGRDFFEFMWSINQDIFGGKSQKAFCFLDTFNVMKKKEMEKDDETIPSFTLPPSVNEEKKISVISTEQKVVQKVQSLKATFPAISKMYTPPPPKIHIIKPKFYTPPTRLSGMSCRQFPAVRGNHEQRKCGIRVEKSKIKMNV